MRQMDCSRQRSANIPSISSHAHSTIGRFRVLRSSGKPAGSYVPSDRVRAMPEALVMRAATRGQSFQGCGPGAEKFAKKIGMGCEKRHPPWAGAGNAARNPALGASPGGGHAPDSSDRRAAIRATIVADPRARRRVQSLCSKRSPPPVGPLRAPLSRRRQIPGWGPRTRPRRG